MADGICWVGLDVHARETTIAVFDQGTGELMRSRVLARPHELLERLMEVRVPARMVYEARPTGYGLARRARAAGIEMAVCAPGRSDSRQVIGSRPTSATRCAWPGGWPPVS